MIVTDKLQARIDKIYTVTFLKHIVEYSDRLTAYLEGVIVSGDGPQYEELYHKLCSSANALKAHKDHLEHQTPD